MQSTLPLNDFTQQGNERCDYGLTHWRTCTLSCIVKTSFVCGAGRPHKTLGHNRCSCNVFLFFNLYCSSWCPCDSWMTRQPGTVVPEVTAIQNWRDGFMLKKEKLARKMHKCKTKTKCFLCTWIIVKSQLDWEVAVHHNVFLTISLPAGTSLTAAQDSKLRIVFLTVSVTNQCLNCQADHRERVGKRHVKEPHSDPGWVRRVTDCYSTASGGGSSQVRDTR